jgi:hypothetical protein
MTMIIVGVVVAVIAVILVCGAVLPVKHTASRQARYPHNPDDLWQKITAYKGDPKLGTKIEESDPPRKLVTRVIDPQKNFGGTWTWEIAPHPQGSVLRITENGEVYNSFFRFVSAFIIGHTRTIEAALKSFGENVSIED